MNADQILFHLGEQPVTAVRLGAAVMILLAFGALAQVAASRFGRRLLWPGSAGGNTVHLLLAAFKVTVTLIGLVAALAVLGVRVLPFVGIVLAAAAIAALSWRTTSEQIWAGLLILWERPFSLGERILVGDYEGEVERVGLRTTTLRSEERMALHVPNSYLTTHAIHNRSKTEGGFGLRIPVEVMVHCDSGEVISALRKAAERNNRVRSSPSPKAFMTGFTPRGLQFELRAWVDAYTDGMWAKNELCRAIQSEFQRAGIQFAAGRPGSRSAMETSMRSRPRDADRERDRESDRRPPRDRERDADREREPRPARSRSERPPRPPRRTSTGDTVSERPHRSHRKTEPETGSRVQASAPEVTAAPQVEIDEEISPFMQEAPAEYDAPAVQMELEAQVEPPYSAPEPAPAPAPEPAPPFPEALSEVDKPEETSPTYGRSKRRIPRR